MTLVLRKNQFPQLNKRKLPLELIFRADKNLMKKVTEQLLQNFINIRSALCVKFIKIQFRIERDLDYKFFQIFFKDILARVG